MHGQKLLGGRYQVAAAQGLTIGVVLQQGVQHLQIGGQWFIALFLGHQLRQRQGFDDRPGGAGGACSYVFHRVFDGDFHLVIFGQTARRVVPLLEKMVRMGILEGKQNGRAGVCALYVGVQLVVQRLGVDQSPVGVGVRFFKINIVFQGKLRAVIVLVGPALFFCFVQNPIKRFCAFKTKPNRSAAAAAVHGVFHRHFGTVLEPGPPNGVYHRANSPLHCFIVGFNRIETGYVEVVKMIALGQPTHFFYPEVADGRFVRHGPGLHFFGQIHVPLQLVADRLVGGGICLRDLTKQWRYARKCRRTLAAFELHFVV